MTDTPGHHRLASLPSGRRVPQVGRSCFCAAASLCLASGLVLGETFDLRSGNAILGLDATTGALVRLADTVAGLELAHEGAELFRLVVVPQGVHAEKPLELSSREAEAVTRTGENGLQLKFEKLRGLDLTATCSMEAGAEGQFQFRIKIEGEVGTFVERVDFPLVSLASPLDGTGTSDAFVLGTTKGGVYERPHQWKPGRYVAATQPGNLAAQFGCYYAPKGGVISYCQDSAGFPKTLVAGRTADGLALGWRFPMRHDLQAPFELPFPVVMGTFRGTRDAPADWRDAASLYKSWALQQSWCARRLAERDDLPDWLLNGPAHVRFGREWLGQPDRIESWLQKYWTRYYPGVPLIVTFWGWEGVASWVPPQYFPPYPSEDGLRRCVEAVRRTGGHAFFWPSGYQWCLSYGKRDDGSFEWEDRARFEREARPHALIGINGQVLLTNPPWYRGGEAATLCRGDQWSRDWLTAVAVDLAKRGGELFQIDQVVGAGMRGGGDCRATGHGHPPGVGVWDVEAAHKQMAEMRDGCRATGVNMVLGYEEPQELFLQEVGIQDYRDYEIAWNAQMPGHRPESVFGYLYHEFVPFFQSNPRDGNAEMTAHCIVTGQMPHLIPHWPVEPHVFPMHGDFEEWAGDVPAGWEHVQGWQERKYAGLPRRDDTVCHSGNSSLRLENDLAGDITQVSRNLSISPAGLRPGGKYRVSAWCRTERLEKPAAINIAALSRELRSRGSWRLPFPTAGDWHDVSTDVTVPATGADIVRVMIHVEGPCRVWVDDFRVDEVDFDGAVHPIVGDGLPAQHRLYQQWIALYHGAGRPYLQLGAAVPPPRAEPAGSVHVGAFRAVDGREAIIVANAKDTRQEVTLLSTGRSVRVSLGPLEMKLLPL
jgi:hypothetical protein